MTDKDRLKALIDELPDAVAGELLNFADGLRQREARRLRDAALAGLNAMADDDEEVTAEEEAAVAASKAESGPSISAAEARRRLLG